MNLWYLVGQSISGRAYRSGLVVCFMVVLAAFIMSTTLLAKSIGHSLRVGTERLGADIIVVPAGKEMETQRAILLGKPVSKAWMPAENFDRIAQVEGIAKVSPQLYLETLTGAACCSAWAMFMIAFDPETDFTIIPWLREKLNKSLGPRDVVGGDWVTIPKETGEILIYGVKVNLAAKIEPTGMGFDQTMFLTFDTAREIAKESVTRAVRPLEIPEGQISAVHVKVKENYAIDEVAKRIMATVPRTYAFASLELTRVIHRQTKGLFRMLFLGLTLVWVLTVVLSGLLFSLTVNERRREIGLLRAIGANRSFIFKLFLAESGILGLGGGLIGVFGAVVFVHLFRFYLMRSAGVPLLIPPLPSVVGFMLACLVIALILALPALLYPAVRATHIDPAVVMREV
ncbi:MAG: FtsX-like permease family protein [Thermodesulfobacteriota bacterium]